jgi:hypothetical protein
VSWTDEQWDAFCGLIEEAWPGSFDDHAAQSWRILLDALEPPAAADGMRRLLLEGHRFRPSASEFLAAARRDPSRPTFDEAYRLIFGPGGALRAQPPAGAYLSLRDREAARRAAVMRRATEMHPLVASFIDRQDVDRLGQLPLEDPEWGEKYRRDLRDAWDHHVEACDGREVAALARGRRSELARLDPLSALGLRDSPALPVGTDGDA